MPSANDPSRVKVALVFWDLSESVSPPILVATQALRGLRLDRGIPFPNRCTYGRRSVDPPLLCGMGTANECRQSWREAPLPALCVVGLGPVDGLGAKGLKLVLLPGHPCLRPAEVDQRALKPGHHVSGYQLVAV